MDIYMYVYMYIYMYMYIHVCKHLAGIARLRLPSWRVEVNIYYSENNYYSGIAGLRWPSWRVEVPPLPPKSSCPHSHATSGTSAYT